jgi:hypothetical protein
VELVHRKKGKVEREFQSFYGGIRAMINDSEIDGEFRDGLWAECASTATYYDNSIINKDEKKSPFNLMFKKRSKGLRNLKDLVKCAWQQLRTKS